MQAAGNAVRHVQAAASAGCQPHLLLTGKSEHLRDRARSGAGLVVVSHDAAFVESVCDRTLVMEACDVE